MSALSFVISPTDCFRKRNSKSCCVAAAAFISTFHVSPNINDESPKRVFFCLCDLTENLEGVV